MAGHSHSSNIMYRKASVDSKRSKVWGKISKAILVAVKMSGPDPDTNLRLRYAIADARAVSMPKDNIERAIKSGSGELGGENIEEVVYEGYGPNGVAVMCDIVTDNRNRTASDVRKIFDVHGGKLGAAGCVAWMFERKGLFLIAADKVAEDKLMELVLDHCADDVKQSGDKFEVTCPPDAFTAVTDALEAAGIPVESKQLTRIPSTTVDLDVETARTVLKLMEELDDHDDVQAVCTNGNIPDEALA